MTAAQYAAARNAYKKNGRNPESKEAQRKYRIKYKRDMINDLEKKYKAQGISNARQKATVDAEDAMKNVAALHEPDMFAGGYYDCKPTCMGSASVNSSIGGQWRNIIAEMDDYADSAVSAGIGQAKINLQLEVCK